MADVGEVGAARAEELLFPQAELLGLPSAAPLKAAAIAARRAKAGRPPGARNKRQEDAARFCVETFGDPLLRQVAVATMDVDELAARLGCKPIEAVVEQRLAAAVVMPFLHSRKPLAVDLRQHGLVQLTFVDGAGHAVVPAGDGAVRTMTIDGEEYQYVTDDANAKV